MAPLHPSDPRPRHPKCGRPAPSGPFLCPGWPLSDPGTPERRTERLFRLPPEVVPPHSRKSRLRPRRRVTTLQGAAAAAHVSCAVERVAVSVLGELCGRSHEQFLRLLRSPGSPSPGLRYRLWTRRRCSISFPELTGARCPTVVLFTESLLGTGTRTKKNGSAYASRHGKQRQPQRVVVKPRRRALSEGQ
jgi:hypothetical protein